MDIGDKLKRARLDAHITQEQAAEGLGVSRQTMSNWENNRTYPDIVSVIKMSDMYRVSLDRLLKEDGSAVSGYVDHLRSSADAGEKRDRLLKAIAVCAYLCIWSFSMLVFWVFMDASDAMGFSVSFLYIILPIATFICSFIIGKNGFWSRKRWLVYVVLGVMHAMAEWASFGLANMVANSFSRFNAPDIILMLIGGGIAALAGELGRKGNGKSKSEE